MKRRSLVVAALLAVVMVFGTSVASAAPITFFNDSNNANPGIDISSQFHVALSADNGDVVFRFTNDVGVASSITAVYFGYLGDLSVINLTNNNPIPLASSSGVIFATGATPPLYKGSGFGGGYNQFYSADSTQSLANGINAADEWLDVRFTLQNGKVFADVYDDLLSGKIVIGMHVQSIGSKEGSDWYRSEPIPEPATLTLLGLGMAGIAYRKLRKTA